MAVRLNVIMVHGAPPTAKAQRVAQSVVGELIGLAGIDLTLIDQIDQIQPTSTDFLTLDSISGDAAVLDWQPPASTVESLNAVGFVGSRACHAHDIEAENAAGSRRVFAFNLNEFEDGQNVIDALRDLLTTRQVKTVSIGSLLPGPAKQLKPSPPAPVDTASGPANDASNPPQEGASPAHNPEADGRPKKSLDLDELVDQLDLLDQ